MNLYTSTLGQIPFTAIEEFLGLNLPDEQRIPEGPRIDFNVQITQDIGDDVASFANTDGGLIFIGVTSDKAKQNVPVAWLGLPARPDYGTQIMSRILSTVHPRPDVEIGWAVAPSGGYIYVVRVATGTYPPYEYLQGNTVRIPIRVHDGKRSAMVRDIESLFRRRQDSSTNPESRLATYINANDFTPKAITKHDQQGKNRLYEYQRIVLLPLRNPAVRLDTRFESDFEVTVGRYFPDEFGTVEHRVRGDYFQLEAMDEGIFPWHYLWRIYRTGALALTASIIGDIPDPPVLPQKIADVAGSQLAVKPIGDLALNLLSMFGLSVRVFHKLEIYGEVNIAQLIVAPNVRFAPKFPVVGRFTDYDLVRGIRIPTPQTALADRATVTYSLDTSELGSPEEAVTEILTYALRELRGIRFDRELFLESVSGLQTSLTNRWKNAK